MRLKPAILGIAALLTAQSAWPQEAIRLKNRSFQPVRVEVNGSGLPAGSHYLLRFKEFPGPAVRRELERRHVRVLAYVPDSALMVSSQRPPELGGLGVTWTGQLDPADKLSPALDSGSTGEYLVFFHADVDPAYQRALVLSLGFDIIENPYLLSGQLLVTGGAGELAALAAADAVAYIFPASTDLVSGAPVMGCAGPVTDAGPVGEYVAAGPGWPRDTSGNVALEYVFQSLTNQMDSATAEGEIERAFREWEKYANVTLSPGTQADAVRTIAILFARGAHGDAYPFDGPGGVLAHTFYPAPPNSEPVAGDMHFDADESWHAGANTDLFSVALHEAGHALGLGHSANPGAVMYPYYRMSSGLTDDDIAGIRALYGAPGTAGTPASPSSPPPAQPPSQPPQPPVQPPSAPPAGDTTPPLLTIVSPGPTITSTTSASLHMTGSASDSVGVTAVRWSTSNGDSGDAAGTTSWTADVPLLVGNTVVTVRAYDAAGNSGWRSITVVRH